MTIEEYVLKNWKRKTLYMMVDDSGFSYGRLYTTCRKLGVEPTTDADLKDAAVLDNYKTLTQAEIAEKFGMTVGHVSTICNKWGITCITPKEKREAELKKDKPRTSFWDWIKKYEKDEMRDEYTRNDGIEFQEDL